MNAPAPGPIPLADQLKCVAREIAMRRRVYPSWVHMGRMTGTAAATEIARMEAVAETLRSLIATEPDVDPQQVSLADLFAPQFKDR